MNSQILEKKLIYSLFEINSDNVTEVGPKAAHLGDLLQAKFWVPEGIVLTTTFFEEFLAYNNLSLGISGETIIKGNFSRDLKELLKARLKNINSTTLVVRSSAIAEDLSDISFAGMYETYLNINGVENVFSAVKKCWASYFDSRVTLYSKNITLSTTPKMAVIIQKQIKATTAGVMFTINPVTGNPLEFKINAIKGLGEQLVSGEVTADEWTITQDKIIPISNNHYTLSMKQIKKLADIGEKIKNYYGSPQDIEWAFENQNLFILQARSVTAIPEYIDWTPQKKGGWLRHFRLGEWLGEPVTPLFATWLLEILDTRIFENMDEATGVPSIQPYNQIINGWYYAQGNFIPSSIPKLLWFGLRYMVPALLTHPRRVGIITTSKAYWSLKLYEQEWREKYKEEYAQKIKKYEHELEQANNTSLLAMIEDIASSAGDNFYSFICVGGSAWNPEAFLAEFYRKHLKEHLESSYQVLLQGLQLPQVQSIQHEVTNLDWYFPTAGELDIKTASTTDTIQKEKVVRDQKQMEAKAKEILKHNKKLSKKFIKLLFEARDAAVLREEQVSLLTLGWPVMRKALLKIGLELAEKKLIPTATDIFFLQYDELVDIVNKSGSRVSFGEVVNQRKELWEKQRKMMPPDTIGDLSPIVIKIFHKYETVLGSTTQKKEGIIFGMPVSAGKVSGNVRIISSPKDFALLQQGEILVAPMTGPAWTPLFTIASAVITDTGSIMAHASLIAREYGIPAIVGTGNATKMLQNGNFISVNGNTGEIVILEKVTN